MRIKYAIALKTCRDRNSLLKKKEINIVLVAVMLIITFVRFIRNTEKMNLMHVKS